MKVHENSKQAYYQDLEKLRGREGAIIHFLKTHLAPMTDREIAEEMGYGHRSEVQPRITELIKAGKARVAFTAPCPATGKSVRHVTAARVHEGGQLALL